MALSLAQAHAAFQGRQQPTWYFLVRDTSPTSPLLLRAHRDPSEEWSKARAARVAVEEPNGPRVVPHFYLTADLIPAGSQKVGVVRAWGQWLLNMPLAWGEDQSVLDVAVVVPNPVITLIDMSTGNLTEHEVALADLEQYFLTSENEAADAVTEPAKEAAAADTPPAVNAQAAVHPHGSRPAAFTAGLDAVEVRTEIAQRLAKSAAPRSTPSDAAPSAQKPDGVLTDSELVAHEAAAAVRRQQILQQPVTTFIVDAANETAT